ncbi:MAG: ergothioneine biosynthesis protein EgtC [Oscillatoriales cyanobacterium]|uniref:Ergothioneine biosynthesis protein EgtC n=1 Tax=Microcoleus anatoxicus PTRS2 TaxID=2705321 RepID=A0ABU8YL60_9CYAN|nr:MAG: ergothioneine biosynthesis protein EgtC [Oscillatoriales cyanobacterium]TAD97490.1 MAG: ergothioneine biosynthesis protein EgtC [Oscillatoriales cyanobacterium]TAE05172.1 MAG: ergothioneine biosynthesis protein EgtC [Oscillatoriales cyanobacterium]TAF01415.1 MAG: ergothioneine biosynthesis protein EgtC [Oscillatoriales cyanobacterium]TAF48133.1 MAG: ergothioneine biosynthesis protein EgtC [Oscillatoriales cyanobacterium]
MCRLLGYLGGPILLDSLLYKPEHSLIVQSYQPREMTSGLLNADGFGIGWYHSHLDTDPFSYKNIQPIWSDINLPSISRYVESGCALAYVRSATVGQAVDLSNCQPFEYNRLMFVHNGFVKNFRQSLYRPIRDRLNDATYQLINGTTDSEHIFGLFVNELTAPNMTIEVALRNALTTLAELANFHEVEFSANIIVSDGNQLVASRFASKKAPPSLYWLRDDPNFPEAVIIASEPLFVGNWHQCPPQSIISTGKDGDLKINSIL